MVDDVYFGVLLSIRCNTFQVFVSAPAFLRIRSLSEHALEGFAFAVGVAVGPNSLRMQLLIKLQLTLPHFL